MFGWLKRGLFAATGGCLGAGIVALIEARAAVQAGSAAHPLAYGSLVGADVAVLTPMAIALGLGLAALSVYLAPRAPQTLREQIAVWRLAPPPARSRAAAIAPLAIASAFVACVAFAHVARRALANGPPPAAGIHLATASIAILIAAIASSFALVPALSRALATRATRSPAWIDPAATGGAVALLAIGAFALGVALGDDGGEGATPFAIFGVLKRNELDLRPVLFLAAIAVCAHIAEAALWRRSSPRGGLVVALSALFVGASVALSDVDARALNRAPLIVRAIEHAAPLGNVALAVVRRATDRDHDGYSPLFGGGDCDDHNARISPVAIDEPGNNIDEDCSGADTPLPKELPSAREEGSGPPPEPSSATSITATSTWINQARTPPTRARGAGQPA